MKPLGKDSKPVAAFVVGMAFYWPMLRDVFFQAILGPQTSSGAEQGFFYLLYLMCIVAVAIAAIALYPRAAISSTPRTNLLVAVGALASTLALVPALPVAESLAIALRTIVMLLCAVLFLLLTLGWSTAVLAIAPSRRMLLAALSFFLSFAISYLAFLPQPFAPVWPALTWVLCPLCLKASLRTAADAAPEPDAPEGKTPVSGYRLALLLVFFLLVGAVARGMMKSGQITTEFSPAVSLAVCTASLLLALLVVLLFWASRQQNRVLLVGVSLLMLVFFLGLLVASIANLALVGANAILVGRTFLMFFLWLVLVLDSRSQTGAQAEGSPRVAQDGIGSQGAVDEMPSAGNLADASAFLAGPSLSGAVVKDQRAAGNSATPRASLSWAEGPLFCSIIFVSVDVLSGFVSYAIVPTMLSLGGITAADFSLFSLGACFVLIAGTVWVLVSLIAEQPAPLSPAPVRPDLRRQVCDQLKGQLSLTQRETELLFLLSQGFSQKRIADELFISTSTEQTHAKSLYRKLGVHSKQEVIDYVNRQMEAVSGGS